MTKLTNYTGDNVWKDGANVVSSDANFPQGHFPDYTIGADNMIANMEEHQSVPSLKENIAKETSQLIKQQERLSVRDLKAKFEKGFTSSNLSDEAHMRRATSLDRHVLLKKLRDTLSTLKGRVGGRNKDDIEEAISMVEALAFQLTQREGELMFERAELKRLDAFLKQVREDAKKVIEEERALAQAEVAEAKEAIKRIEMALHEHETTGGSSQKEELEQLRKEIQEARRIKMLHQPSKVKDMEFEIQALRKIVVEKSQLCIQLQQELAMIKKLEVDGPNLFEIKGLKVLGSQLGIVPSAHTAPDLLSCPVQWFRVNPVDECKEPIAGATKFTYPPEPFDVGMKLQAEIIVGEEVVLVQTTGPISPAAGLDRYVEALLKRVDIEFNVIVTRINNKDNSSNSVHVLHIGKQRMKLCKGRFTKAREQYSSTMLLCGARGGGNAAAQAVFWQPRKGQTFTLVFETNRDRNAAIMVARRFASDLNVVLSGPEDHARSVSLI